jgi:hypothetical protein
MGLRRGVAQGLVPGVAFDLQIQTKQTRLSQFPSIFTILQPYFVKQKTQWYKSKYE